MTAPGTDASQPVVDWEKLESLTRTLAEIGPGALQQSDWQHIDDALDLLEDRRDWPNVLRLRGMFSFLIRSETTAGEDSIVRLCSMSLKAARSQGDTHVAAQCLYDNGINLHLQGFHRESISAFNQAEEMFIGLGATKEALMCRYFSSLPHRALGHRDITRSILDDVLSAFPKDDPWRANPLEVRAWLARDDKKYREAEGLLIEALDLYSLSEGKSSVHYAQTLTDLGEVLSMQGKAMEAKSLFDESIAIFMTMRGLYARQEARTYLRYAELLNRTKEYDKALNLLDKADDKIRGYGHYHEMTCKIELARARAFFGKRDVLSSFRKLRMVLMYRDALKMSLMYLIRYAMGRWI